VEVPSTKRALDPEVGDAIWAAVEPLIPPPLSSASSPPSQLTGVTAGHRRQRLAAEPLYDQRKSESSGRGGEACPHLGAIVRRSTREELAPASRFPVSSRRLMSLRRPPPTVTPEYCWCPEIAVPSTSMRVARRIDGGRCNRLPGWQGVQPLRVLTALRARSRRTRRRGSPDRTHGAGKPVGRVVVVVGTVR
jgi:hypothetical protein